MMVAIQMGHMNAAGKLMDNNPSLRTGNYSLFVNSTFLFIDPDLHGVPVLKEQTVFYRIAPIRNTNQ